MNLKRLASLSLIELKNSELSLKKYKNELKNIEEETKTLKYFKHCISKL